MEIAAIEAQPRGSLVIGVDFICSGSDSEKLESQIAEDLRGVVKLGEGGVAVDSNIVPRGVVDDGELGRGEETERQVGGERWPLRNSRGDHLAIGCRAKASGAKCGFVEHEGPPSRSVLAASVASE